MNQLIDFVKQIKKNVIELDRNIVIIFLSIVILQTVSWYLTSRTFFRNNIYDNFDYLLNIDLFEYIYWFLSDFIILFIVPCFLIKYVLKNRLSDFGLNLSNFRLGIKIVLVAIIIMLPIIWVVSAFPEFSEKYPLLQSTKSSFSILLVYEAGLFLFMLGWEFIWRGFTLFGLEKKFGFYAVFIQMIPFVILHNGKPFLETFGAIGGGLFLGILAFQTRSIWYGFLIHFFVMFSIDMISILREQSNSYGIALESVVKIFNNTF